MWNSDLISAFILISLFIIVPLVLYFIAEMIDKNRMKDKDIQENYFNNKK